MSEVIRMLNAKKKALEEQIVYYEKSGELYFFQETKKSLSEIETALVALAPKISLAQAKQLIADREGKSDWEWVLRDYEHGIGISKKRSFEETMGEVAMMYKANGNEDEYIKLSNEEFNQREHG